MKQKDNNSLREISDASHSSGHSLAKTLHKLFKNYTGKTSTYIKNGKDFIDILKTTRFQKGGIYVSCDADKLFPSIIVPEGLQILEKKMRYDFKLHTRTDLPRKERIELTILVTSEPCVACELGSLNRAKVLQWEDREVAY